MNIYDRVKRPDTSSEDASIIRRGIRNALLAMISGGVLYLVAAVVSLLALRR